MATKRSGPAAFCAREAESCHDMDGKPCEACANGEPFNCAFPYRPGKTREMRVQGIRTTFLVRIPEYR